MMEKRVIVFLILSLAIIFGYDYALKEMGWLPQSSPTSESSLSPETEQVTSSHDQFTHKLHVGLGIQCLYCHPGALRGPSPGLPTQTKCWGCHQQIAKTKTSPKLAVLVDYVQKNKQIQWIPVAQVPDFVHFNHRPHVAAGLNCETCHGDMTKVDIAENTGDEHGLVFEMP